MDTNGVQMDNTAAFARLKGELVDQVDKVASVAGCLEIDYPAYAQAGRELKKTAERIKRSSNEDLFSIALGAGFQAGKSTTCDAFANGREISPRGRGSGGVRTSSCIVQISSTDVNPRAVISWREPVDIRKQLADCLGLPDGKEAGMGDSDRVQNLWLRVYELADAYCADQNSLKGEQLDKLEQAITILAFHDDEKLDRWREKRSTRYKRPAGFWPFRTTT